MKRAAMESRFHRQVERSRSSRRRAPHAKEEPTGRSHHTHDAPPGDTVSTLSDEVGTPESNRCGYALRAAVTMLLLVATGGPEYLVNELRLKWNRLRPFSPDEAGYTTKTAMAVGLVVLIAFTAFVALWMTVISKAIHTRVGCHPGKPCG
jgi:hypothetical protein